MRPMKNTAEKTTGWDRFLKLGTGLLMCIILIIVMRAIFGKKPMGEAPAGSFSAWDFNEGWQLREGVVLRPLRIPVTLDRRAGDEIVIVNTLPEDLSDGMSMMMRASMEDILIYIDGELRTEYSTEGIQRMNFYIPSAYIVTELNSEDAGKEICVQLRVKTRGVVNGVRLGYGNNVWFSVIKDNMPVNIGALILFLAAVTLLGVAIPLEKTYRVAAPRQLSLLMINTAIWIFSESKLRQIFFQAPSKSQYIAYLTVELIAVLALAYFDEVQHRVYHRRYLIMELIAFFQLLINIFLHLTGILPFYRSLVFSHIWSAISAIVAISCIVTDVIRGRVKEYKITAAGIICFVILAVMELVGFYVNNASVAFGTSLCIAQMALMVATIIQTVRDEAYASRDRERARAEMTINTIETIAGSIDARDECTGGHSDRVSVYAGILAHAMMEKYQLTEEDVLRIRYIGLVHDIGKIGMAESILNKPGKLTEEEYNLMKKHVDIGYELMLSMGSGMPGMLDGIRYHHERYNGSGYPDGLSGANIPLVARILALADSYDAMTSNRVYRKRLTNEEVRAEIQSCSGRQFDPALVRIFIRLLDEGTMKPWTVEGLAADSEGRVFKSAVLEGCLLRDLRNGKEISEPSHVRMLCYVMKLQEKQGRGYRVYFISCGEDHDAEEQEMLRSVLRMKLTAHDINIRYTEEENLVALYDYTEEQAEGFLDSVRSKCPMMQVRDLDDREKSGKEDETDREADGSDRG